MINETLALQRLTALNEASFGGKCMTVYGRDIMCTLGWPNVTVAQMFIISFIGLVIVLLGLFIAVIAYNKKTGLPWYSMKVKSEVKNDI